MALPLWLIPVVRLRRMARLRVIWVLVPETASPIPLPVPASVMAAAVADFRPAVRSGGKLKKGNCSEVTCELTRNPDILADLGKRRGKALLVGFAAETDDLEANALKKLREKGLDLIVANDVTAPGAGFGEETNVVRLFDRQGGVEALPCLPKDEVADRLLERIVVLLQG